jgi:hypothetical protein
MLIQLDLENELFNIALEELRIKISNREELSTFEFLILPNKEKESYIENDGTISTSILHLIQLDLTKKFFKTIIEEEEYLNDENFNLLDKSLRKLYVETLVEFAHEDCILEFYEFQYLEEDSKLDYVTNTGLNSLSEPFRKWFSAYKRQLKMDSILK